MVGSNTAFVNSKPILLDVPPVIENGRTFAPIRFISENLQKQVDWDSTAKTIYITDTNSNTATELPSTDNPSSAAKEESSLQLISETTTSIDVANIHPAFVKHKDSKGFNEIYGQNKIDSRYKPMEEIKGVTNEYETTLSASELQSVTVELIIPSFRGLVDEVQATYTANYFYDETYILSYNAEIYLPFAIFGDLVMNKDEFSTYSYDNSVYENTIYMPPYKLLDLQMISSEPALANEELIINECISTIWLTLTDALKSPLRELLHHYSQI